MPQLTSIDIGRDACRMLSCLYMPRLATITTRCGPDSFVFILQLFAEGDACPRTIHDFHIVEFSCDHLRFSDPQVLQQLVHLLQTLEDMSTFTMDISWGVLLYFDAFVPAEVVVDRIVSLGLLPNLTEITIRTGGHSAPSRLCRLVREMMHARAAPSTINGRDVVVLERVVTDFDYASQAEQEVDG
ncbi:hypothetical protein K525DRAFT_212577 [Schizophyllum commune Loenen D]|nr:hypothetical protein K525DRAFT_212577 [Schizophyllum commune Loenen D]